MTLHQRGINHKLLVARQDSTVRKDPVPVDPLSGSPSSSTVIQNDPHTSTQSPSSTIAIPKQNTSATTSTTSSTQVTTSSTLLITSTTSTTPTTTSTSTTPTSTSTKPIQATTSIIPIVHNGGGSSDTSYYVPTTTGDGAASTVSADPASSDTSAVSAGSIAGGVLGGLAGLAVLGFVAAFFLRRLNRRNRRRRLAMRPQSEFSTFGNFGPADSATSPEDKLDDVTEKRHNVAPSISSSIAMNLAGYGASGGAAPSDPVASPSEALAASNAPTAIGAPHLHERPKYVFGQSRDGDQPDVGENHPMDTQGAYNSHLASYDQNAYGYAGGSGYQDAERAYQATGVEAAAGGYYDQNGYYYSNSGDPNAYAAGVGQYYDYSQQQQHAQYQHHGQTPSQSQAYGGM